MSYELTMKDLELTEEGDIFIGVREEYVSFEIPISEMKAFLKMNDAQKLHTTSQHAKFPSFEDVLNECYVPSYAYAALFKGVYDAVKKLGNFA
jgi:hypothetical protein